MDGGLLLFTDTAPPPDDRAALDQQVAVATVKDVGEGLGGEDQRGESVRPAGARPLRCCGGYLLLVGVKNLTARRALLRARCVLPYRVSVAAGGKWPAGRLAQPVQRLKVL